MKIIVNDFGLSIRHSRNNKKFKWFSVSFLKTIPLNFRSPFSNQTRSRTFLKRTSRPINPLKTTWALNPCFTAVNEIYKTIPFDEGSRTLLFRIKLVHNANHKRIVERNGRNVKPLKYYTKRPIKNLLNY